MIKLIVKPTASKQKQGKLAKITVKSKALKQSKANKYLIILKNKLKKTKLYLIFIMFLAFFQDIDNPYIKIFSLKVM